MNRVAIVENDPKAPSLRGGAAEMWKYKGPECLISGPAETGKTYACLLRLHTLCSVYPNVQAVIVRKVRDTMHGTVLSTYERKILGADTPVRTYGGEKSEWYDYPNGSRIWVAGMDNPGKALSSERDFICVNQAEEIDLAAWEVLTSRATGRAGNAPYAQTFGDCNPGPAFHWIKRRETLKLFESRHEDNPVLWTKDQFNRMGWTEQGKRTMAVLDALTGVRRERLRYGRWVSAEGLVYETFDTARHVVTPFHLPPDWPRARAVDFGYSNPFVCLWGALDPDGRLYVYREVYMSQRTVAEHAPFIKANSWEERYEVTVADHDREDRETLHQCGIWTMPAMKLIEPGIQAVKDRLAIQPDGRPRLFLFRNMLLERDRYLMEKGDPTCTEEEFALYQYAPPTQLHKTMKEVPLGKWDHGMDCLRYLVCWADSRTRSFEGKIQYGGSNIPNPQFKLIMPPTSAREKKEKQF